MKSILFLTHTNNNCCAVKLNGVYASARSRGWTVNVVEFGCSALSITEAVAILRPDGIIFEGGRLSEKVNLRPLRNIPSVYLDTDFNVPGGAIAIRSDAKAIANLAADELLASAPAETAFFTQHPHKEWSRQRERAFRERMLAANIRFRTVENTMSLAGLKRPFAVFAATDPAAAMVFRTATILGLNCPQDFTLVSVDNDLLFCENAQPKVSSIEQDFFGTGVAAVETLERQFRHDVSRSVPILIPPLRLVRRASSVRPRTDGPIPKRIDSCIEIHALEGLSVADIVAQVGCSRRTAETLFRAAFGHSINEAILRRKFLEVERLLANPHQILEPIANLCGWTSSAHLKRSFKQRYGLTMSEWRAQALAKHSRT